MNEKRNPDNRQIKMNNQGNYNESIGRDYIQGNAYYFNSEQKQNFPKICKNQEELEKYLSNFIQNLQQKFGFINFKYNLINENRNFKLIARNSSFEMSIGLIPLRGEAFFIFFEFDQINFISLKAFSTQCLDYAKTKTNSSTVGSAGLC